MGSLLYLLLYSGCVVQLVTAGRFMVIAPSVFHVGVKEKVSVQAGENKKVTCYLENEVGNIPMSEKKTAEKTEKGKIETLTLEVPIDKLTSLSSVNAEIPYLNLVCDVGEIKRVKTRVLVSHHRGYIFIQTNQPIYNPAQKVQYRIFTLDHSMRPISDKINVYIINADGNTIKKVFLDVKDGIYSGSFHIPDVSQPGVWKIKAHYQDDENGATVRDFKVQKFVLPSFVVTINPDEKYLLSSSGNLKLVIDASYSYGKKISGGFHSRFGLKQKMTDKIKFLKGLEQIGPVKDGVAEITIKISDIQKILNPDTLEKLAEEEARFYIAATVTDTLSGEVQESEILIPIMSQKYKVDLSRTRSYFVPKVPVDVRVVVRTPTGLPAKNVPVSISVSSTSEKSQTAKTNEEGEVISVFNLKEIPSDLSVEVTVNGFISTKKIFRATSSNGNFLRIGVTNKVLSLGDQLEISFHVINGKPEDGYIYYLILSKGSLKKVDSVNAEILSKCNLQISSDMIPSFRIIGYYYDTNGEIIADSIWVDVKDACESKLQITEKTPRNFHGPGEAVELLIDVENNRQAKVALLAVDKAIYALNADNKLTPKQVFAAMQSYDLGCSYGGGKDNPAVFNDAGLSFISHSQTFISQMRKGFSCESGFRRQKRSLDVQTELMTKETEYSDEQLRKCCRHGMLQILMKLTCEERKKRMIHTSSSECVDVFMKCCIFATKLREQKRKEDTRSGHGRTSGSSMVEDFFDNEIQQIRSSFPPSFEFKVIELNGKTQHNLYVPDSITTWEIQALSLSHSYGFCVAEPLPIRVFQELFISMKLPYSVKPNEQMALVVVIYNYGKNARQLAIHMKQVDGLCSPGTINSYFNFTLKANSAETVTFSAVPLIKGEIPITIQLYDTEYNMGVDAIQKTLLVVSEGVQIQEVKSYPINLNAKSEVTVTINADFPNSTIPDSVTNLFVKIEGAHNKEEAVQLLSPDKVKNLIRAPYGCAEQTMITVSPTALSIRYLDFTNRWLELPTDTRDKAMNHIQKGYDRILTFKKPDGSYGAWLERPSSTWLTALVVKVLSLVAKCQLDNGEQEGIVSQLEIRASVNYLIKKQNEDGSFSDPHPVIHREMQGGIGGFENDASLTAFITIALNHSFPFLDHETDDVKKSISRATEYLLTRIQDLKRPFSVAVTAYCLSTCLEDRTKSLPAWEKLKKLGEQEGECKVWKASANLRLVDEHRTQLVPSEVALAVETTAYALLTALEHDDFEEAKKAACFLSSQENYEGGFKSTQDTIMALEALSEYRLRKPDAPFTTINVQFSSLKRREKESLTLNKKNEKTEAELQRLLGGDVIAKISGNGEAKMKVVKAYYAKNPSSNCDQLSIKVTVQGKVDYNAHIIETYNYYDYDDYGEKSEKADFPSSAIEWFDARTRYRRDTEESLKTENKVVYTVCVRFSLGQNSTGMSIADITLLSGFEPIADDLDRLKDLSDKYISHYEISQGRVILYFNEMPSDGECIAFEARQTVPIGLLQPAPASLYDYYEPERKCTVFYAAPKRSKMVSVLCSGEVCQCAERACFKEKSSEELITMEHRFKHACYQPVSDYGFVAEVISVEDENNFEMYTTKIVDVLKYNKDIGVVPNDIRVFAKRKHCKAQLKTNQTYLIMGNDGSTTDSRGQMLYLLDSNTWIEEKPNNCKATRNVKYCGGYRQFVKQIQVNGCHL